MHSKYVVRRTCEATSVNAPTLLSNDDCLLCNENEHRRRCDVLQGACPIMHAITGHVCMGLLPPVF